MFSWEDFSPLDSIYLTDVELSRLATSSWISFADSCPSNTFSSSSKLILILPYSNLKIYRIYSDITSLISNITNFCLLSLLLFLRFYLFLDREEGGGREGEKHRCEIETWISCLPQAPNLGPGPQPRHVL